MYTIKTGHTLYRFSDYCKALEKFKKLWKQRKEATLWKDNELIGAIYRVEKQIKGKYNYYIDLDKLQEVSK